MDIICGSSENQRNDVSKEKLCMYLNRVNFYILSQKQTMLLAFICHVPSGASIKQILHYGQGIRSGSFGKYTKSFRRPSDFRLSQITTPITLHYSTADKLADATDVTILISKLKNSMVYVQPIDEPKFNHIDFVWGIKSASLIYSKILKYFEEYQ